MTRNDPARRGIVRATALNTFLPLAKRLASVPVSGFRVGAAALGASGRVWLGANQEFSGLPLNFTVHAEQAAVLNARAHGERKLSALAVSAAPCGCCRQFLRELKSPLEVLLDDCALSIDGLLPRAFDLGEASETLLSGAVDFSCCDGLPIDDAARQAARASYSPYTRTKSGVALRLVSGRVFLGSLLECAAYNPSLSSLQCALALRALWGAQDDPVAEAVLAERGTAPLGAVFEALIGRVAHGAKTRVVAAD